jgi:outer membrane protein
MKKIILILLSVFFFNGSAFPVPLSKALLQAYNENPVLNAERENIQVSIET